jgi:hypothetical protein
MIVENRLKVEACGRFALAGETPASQRFARKEGAAS